MDCWTKVFGSYYFDIWNDIITFDWIDNLLNLKYYFYLYDIYFFKSDIY